MTPRMLRRSFLVLVGILLGLGIVGVYSSSAIISEVTYGESLRFLRQHVFAIVVGLALGLGSLMLPYARVRVAARWLLVASVGLLALVLVVGPEVGGAQRWLRIGRWSLQPAELAQFSLVLYLADLFARRAGSLHDLRRGLLPALGVTGLMGGLVLAQPDFGTAAAMGVLALMLMAVAKVPGRQLLGLVAVAAVGLVILVAGAEYRRQRILTFLNPLRDPTGSGYQILQSYLALASGGLLGAGIGASLQKLFYLPSAHTDFIFAVLGEELGLLGATAVIGAFALFLLCGFRLAMLSQDRFSTYVICGLVGMIGLEAIINLGVVTGLLPTKGLPLPLISYGGTSMVVNLLACALILKASRDGEEIRGHNTYFQRGLHGNKYCVPVFPEGFAWK